MAEDFDYQAEMHDLVNKNKITENLFNYCRGQDRKELDLMLSAFWPEATDDHGAFVGNAHEFCRLAYNGYEASGHTALHHSSNVLIELEGSKAKCESAFLYVWTHAGKKQTKLLGGRYKDLCEKRAGEWKILRRETIFDWANEVEGAQEFSSLFGFPPTALIGNVFPKDRIYAEW